MDKRMVQKKTNCFFKYSIKVCYFINFKGSFSFRFLKNAYSCKFFKEIIKGIDIKYIDLNKYSQNTSKFFLFFFENLYFIENDNLHFFFYNFGYFFYLPINVNNCSMP